MKILVSGATGMIGSALVPALRDDGHAIVGISRRARGGDRDGVHWDPEHGEIDADALTDIDAVIHLAGANLADGRWTSERKRQILESRVKGTRLLVHTFAQFVRRPRVFLSASAVGFYGDTGEAEVDESIAPGSGFLAHVCRRWEAEALRAAPFGIRVVLVRSGMVLEPTGGALARLLPVFRTGLGGPVGGGRQWMSWIAIDDWIALVRHALARSEIEGPINAVAPHPVRNSELAEVLGRVLGRPARVPAPALAVKLLLGAELAEQTVLQSCRAIPRRAIESGFVFQFPALESALQHLLERD